MGRIGTGRYVHLLSELLNQDPDPRERERRVREANREMFREVVSERGSTAQADLALAQAALQGGKPVMMLKGIDRT